MIRPNDQKFHDETVQKDSYLFCDLISKTTPADLTVDISQTPPLTTR